MSGSETRQSGIQELISRIRDEGVESGREEAENLVAEARRQAAELLERAREEARELHERTRSEIATEKQASLEALKLAARDTALQLESDVIVAFERFVKRLITPVTRDPEVLRALVLVLAGHAVEEFVQDRELRILVSDLFFKEVDESPALSERTQRAVLGISGDMLREGIEIVPSSDVEGGARVHLVGEELEIDLSEETVHRVMMKHLLPRFRAILSGEG